MSANLRKISTPEPYLVETVWSDGFTSTIKTEVLRDNCPCADCNEDKAKKDSKFGFISLSNLKPGKNAIAKIEVVGNYAITPTWKDGHDTGIYTFELLRQIFEDNKLSDEDILKIKELREKSKNN
jgi:DUF971 family protein